VNVTVTGQSRNGNISLSPDCSHMSSTVNYLAAGYPRANLTLVGLDASASFCAYNAGGSVHLIVDLLGYIGPSGSALYVPLASPVRVVDTRYGNGGIKAPLGAHGTIAETDAGLFDVPYTATALLIDVISVGPTATSWFQVYPGSSKPASRTSTLNFTAGRVVSNAAITGLTARTFGAYNDAGSAHAVVDLFGYFV